jgi:hypothetical protein
MQQNDSTKNGSMSVVVVNVALIASPIIPIANATPNQPRIVATTHASTNVAWPSATIA